MFYIKTTDVKGMATFADLYKGFNLGAIKDGVLAKGMQLKPIMYNDILGAVTMHTPRTGRMKKYTYAQAFEDKQGVTIRLGVMTDRAKSDSPFYTPFLEDGTGIRILFGRSRKNKKKYPRGANRGKINANPYIWAESLSWETKLSNQIPATIEKIVTTGHI